MRTSRTLSLAATIGPVAFGALALAACGSTPAPGAGAGGTETPAASVSSTASSTPAAHKSGGTSTASVTCPSSALKVTLETSAAGVAAGNSLVPLEFKNVSASSCKLPDYPSVSFASGSAGPDIGTPAVRQRQGQAQVLVLAPGEFAHAWLQIVDVANYPASKCKPVTASGLRVGFATAASTSFVARTIQACAQAPQGSDILAVFPVQAGQAKRGTAP